MEENRELNLNEMDKVTGGVTRTINTNIDGVNAAIRKEACKSSAQKASLKNGTIVDTIDEQNLVWDPVEQRHFVQIRFINKSGQEDTGWVASSIVGLKR